MSFPCGYVHFETYNLSFTYSLFSLEIWSYYMLSQIHSVFLFKTIYYKNSVRWEQKVLKLAFIEPRKKNQTTRNQAHKAIPFFGMWLSLYTSIKHFFYCKKIRLKSCMYSSHLTFTTSHIIGYKIQNLQKIFILWCL